MQRTEPLSARPRIDLADRGAIVILCAVALIAAFTFRDYGLGWDDFTHAQYGDLLVHLYGSGFADTRALSFVNLNLYGGGFDLAAALVAKVLPFDLFETRRLVGAAVGITGLAVTWRLARLVGGPLAGLIALALLAACPIYYGHMFMNPKDAPFAAVMALLLLAFARAFQEYPRPAPTTVMLFGIGLGLTIGSRIIGGMAALFAAAGWLVIVAAEVRASGARRALRSSDTFLLRLLPGLLLGYAVMALVWPWGVVSPLNPFRALFYFSEFFEKPWQEIFAGRRVLVPDMPRSYLPTLLALKLPEVFSVLAAAGLAIGFIRITQRREGIGKRAVLALVIAAALIPVLVTVLTRPALYNGIRHFMFIVPPLAVLGGYGGAWFLERLRGFGVAAMAAGVLALAAGLTLPIVEAVRLHPYQYTYFNTTSGGVAHARGRYMLDYWGLSFKQAAQQLVARLGQQGVTPPSGRAWKIAVCGPHPPARVVLGPGFEPTWDAKGADFALVLGEFYCAELPAPVLGEVNRDGVTYARAYDLRGREIDRLFTLPPVR